MTVVSVIMPVYNQERYLNKSLESLANQNYKNFELLIIDDGSNDASAEICKTYCKKRPTWKYYKKENGGVGSARQYGLDRSSGEFVIHVDPDDWIEPEFLSELVATAISQDSDIVMCNYIEEFENKSNKIDLSFLAHTSIEELRLHLASGKYWGVLWNKLIRSSRIKNKVNFEKGIDFQEDLLFLFRALGCAKKVSLVPRYLYHYNRTNMNSALNSIIDKKKIIQTWIVKRLIVESTSNLSEKRDLEKYIVPYQTIISTWKNKDISISEFKLLIEPFKYGIRRHCIADMNPFNYDYFRMTRGGVRGWRSTI